jgi:hypothetical protein
MVRALLLLAPLIAAAVPHDEPDLPDFGAQRRFADPASCRAHMADLVAEARRGGFDAAEGPYDVADGESRAHTVRAAAGGHRIAEYRCLADRFSARAWTHSMVPAEEDFTVESVARRAPWLQHGGRQH